MLKMVMRKIYIETVSKLVRIIDSSDVCRRRHCYKIERYSLLVCKQLNVPIKEAKAIKMASILHDIGKIGIDLAIIKKSSKLTPEEWNQIRLHPDIGANIIKQLDFLSEIVPIIKHHHERFAGGGYPDPDMSGEKIPLGSRIISVTDAFDAMTSDRPYRKAMSKEAAAEELKKCSGNQFDPRVVDAFLNIVPIINR